MVIHRGLANLDLDTGSYHRSLEIDWLKGGEHHWRFMSPTMEKRSERLRTSTGFRWKLSFPSTSTLLNLDRDIAGILVHIPDQDHTAIPPAALQSCSPIIPPAFMDYWISLTSLEKMAQTDYDVLIVGSGAEGGAVL